MDWDKEKQARLDALRMREISGALTDPERAELATILEKLEAEEARALAPALARLREDVAARQQKIGVVQADNEELAKLLAQERQLAAEARRFLIQFDERSASIREGYARLMGEALPST